MSTHTPQDDNAAAGTASQGKPRRRFLAGVLTGGLLGSLLAGGASIFSHAYPGHGMFRGSHGGWGHHWRSGGDPGERAAFFTGWMLSRINASDTQKQQITTLVQATVQELRPLREQHEQHRQAMFAALSRSVVERDALHALRQAELQLAEEASQRFVDTIADIAEVLTPEQRTSLLDMVQRFHEERFP